MLPLMHFEIFAKGNSLLHKLDPRAKVLSAFVCAITFALLQTLFSSLLALVFGVGLVVLGRFPLRALLQRLLVINIFVFFLWLVLPFSYNTGAVLFSLGPFTARAPGLDLALLITVKSNAIVLSTLSLLGSMPMFALVRALQALHVPNKLVQILFFSLRYFQLMHGEYERLRASMAARAFKPGTNLHTYRSYAWLLSMLFARSLDRAERVYEAMLCRGYRGKLHSLQTTTCQGRDLAFLGVTLLICVVSASLSLKA